MKTVMAAVAMGSVVGAGGSLAYYWGWRGQHNRREAIMQGLQRKILHRPDDAGVRPRHMGGDGRPRHAADVDGPAGPR